STIASSAAAPLTKNAVRTTFVSGSCSTMRRFGCQAGTVDADASLLLVSDGAILGYVLDHQAEQAEPVEVPCRLGERIRDNHTARPQPRQRIEFKGCDA